MGGIASMSGSRCVESWALAADRRTVKGMPVAVHDQVELGAALAAIGRVGAGVFAPLLARTLTLSTLARDQSTAASSPSQSSNLVCKRSQTPAACQSRRRRQQVVPLPQSSSFGTSRQGQPVRRTKTMPPRMARSGTCGLPPLGLGGSLGNSGSMASQRSSGTRGEFFMEEEMPRPRGSETRSKSTQPASADSVQDSDVRLAENVAHAEAK